MLKGLEVWYGKATEEDRERMTSIGLPANKFDAAVISMMVLYDAATPEEEFVGDFFWGKNDQATLLEYNTLQDPSEDDNFIVESTKGPYF